ncbi:hypothetical protein [Roseateles sp.]|uniref:hypothetical protein n=1 Tax=Roseateles sp. TaxID=1971397 RepID=UPI00286AE2B3|nr:hypothetical protein [Roseateles sp.]
MATQRTQPSLCVREALRAGLLTNIIPASSWLATRRLRTSPRVHTDRYKQGLAILGFIGQFGGAELDRAEHFTNAFAPLQRLQAGEVVDMGVPRRRECWLSSLTGTRDSRVLGWQRSYRISILVVEYAR